MQPAEPPWRHGQSHDSSHHGLGRPLQLFELRRLVADPVGHLLEIACDIRKLDPQGADACGQFETSRPLSIGPAIIHGADYAPTPATLVV